MNAGGHLTDRMVDVAHRRSGWTDLERAHLRDCAECAAEWRLVIEAAALGAGMPFDAERIAATVVGRLATHRGSPVRRYGWVVGLAAAAALAFAVVRTEPRNALVAAPTEAPAILSGLDDLTSDELLAVLDVFDPLPDEPRSDAETARLGDLTTSELERVLRSLEG